MVVLRSFVILLLGGVASVQAVGRALGYGSATTGGGSAAAATPTSNAELLSWLADSTPRTIVLTRVFDFTNQFGTTSGKTCRPWKCSAAQPSAAQVAINQHGWCDQQSFAATETATWNKAGTGFAYSLKVGSNKTLLGKGSGAGIKGIGLLIQNSRNVIVQNIGISDINHEYVWGGDAITIVGSTDVWIDHNNIKNVGRQFIVTGYAPAQNLTISNNVFDGRTAHSAMCNGKHYWVALFLGSSDTITFAQNYVYNTSGRGPHIGGTAGNNQLVHIVNNYYVSVGGHALDSQTGAFTLVEGNFFNTVSTPSVAAHGGNEYFIQTSGDLTACKAAFGRTCQANALASSGSVARADTPVLNTLKSHTAITKYWPMTASATATYVQANAGVGRIDF